MIAKVPKIDVESMKNQIDNLCDLNSESQSVEIVSGLKDLVPEFKSNNSIYEKLDVVSKVN